MSSKSANSTLKPAQEVFNTTELLEHILSYMPMTHVLGKSRVSRKWKAVIDDSPALQKKLFLRPNNSQVEVLPPDHDSPELQILPQSLDWAQLTFLSALANMPVYTSTIELNPLVNWGNQGKLHVTHEIEVVLSMPCYRYPTGLRVISGKYSSSYVRHRFGRSLQKPQTYSSWRKMYVTTPPVTDIVIHVPTIVCAGSSTLSQSEHIRVNIHSEHGVTLGLLHDEVEDTLQKFRMKDGRSRVQMRKEGPLKEEDYVKGWGKQEQIMFLVQPPKEDAADLESQ